MPTSSTVRVQCPTCPVCGDASTMTVSRAGFAAWSRGALIQVAFPDMSAGEREQLKTGYHPACWDAMFDGIEDDDEDDGCPGHRDDDNSIAAGMPMGQTYFCDGSCQL